jgi:glucose-6-phosphate isomerase, archaeal
MQWSDLIQEYSYMNEVPINELPVSVELNIETGIFTPCPETTQRRVSDLGMMFADGRAVANLISSGDPIVYEIRYHPFKTSNSDMALGVTTIHPGKVGNEYYMTKGHFHEADDQPEIYFCVKGEGYLLMETRAGDFRMAPWKPGVITHIPPAYAHRVVNTGEDALVFVASFHLSAGHEYDGIIQRGFAQILVEENGKTVFLPNPRR